MKKGIICLTGGIDSAVTAIYLREKKKIELCAVFFDYGQKAYFQERKAFEFFTKNLEIKTKAIIKIPYGDKITHPHISGREVPYFEDNDLYNHSKHVKIAQMDFIPYRNLSFAVLAAIYAETINAKEIVFGFNADSTLETCPDATQEFLDSSQQVLDLSILDRKPVKVMAPLINYKKSEIIKLGNELKVQFKKTYSCFRGEDKHCGRCEGCVKRRSAFLESEVPDPTVYEVI